MGGKGQIGATKENQLRGEPISLCQRQGEVPTKKNWGCEKLKAIGTGCKGAKRPKQLKKERRLFGVDSSVRTNYLQGGKKESRKKGWGKGPGDTKKGGPNQRGDESQGN